MVVGPFLRSNGTKQRLSSLATASLPLPVTAIERDPHLGELLAKSTPNHGSSVGFATDEVARFTRTLHAFN